MRHLLIEPFGGMAGDMFLAALLDLGDERFTLAELSGLADALLPGECRLVEHATRRASIGARRLEVVTPETGTPVHRHLADLEALVARAPLGAEARRHVSSALRRIAEAEAAVHQVAVAEIHFHEVGAVDTLVDLCGAALGLERLGVERAWSTPPLTGEGTVHCAHGELPVPAPAVCGIMRGRRLGRGGGDGERLTPTGAAILAEWSEELADATTFTPERVGYGAGERETEVGPPNLVRVQLGTPGAAAGRPTVWQLEVNLDDATGEEIGWCLEGLRAQGALDVWTQPLQMKKGRPGVLVAALCRQAERAALEAVVLERSPSLGLRWSAVERLECAREELIVDVLGQPVRIKRRVLPDGVRANRALDDSPEYEDLVRLAAATGRGLRELEELARRAAE